MAAYVAPRRVTSDPCVVTVAAAQAQTALYIASQATLSDNFHPFKGGGLDTRVPHPVTGVLVDCTEDSAHGTPSIQSAIQYTSRGAYDSVTKKAMWAGNGANHAVTGGYVYNMHTIYDETNDLWSCSRGNRGPNETTSAGTYGHNYDSNAIDPITRTFYKKSLQSMQYVRYNLDTNIQGNTVTYYPQSVNEVANGDGSFEWITQRSRMWIRSRWSGSDKPNVWEFNAAMNSTTLLFPDGSFGSFYRFNSGSPLVYNPRAFGGAGGVFMGTPQAYTIELTSTLSVANSRHTNTTGAPASVATEGFDWPIGGHVCCDPVGDGWLYMDFSDFHMYKLSSGPAGPANSGTWTQRSLLPLSLRNNPTIRDYILISLDAYGVIWIIGNQLGQPERAWLYRP